jgi:hypothetical protein
MPAHRLLWLAAALAVPIAAGCGGGGGSGSGGGGGGGTGAGAQITPAQQQLIDQTEPAAVLAPSASAQYETAMASHTANAGGLLVASLQATPGVASVEQNSDQASLIVNMSSGGSFSIALADMTRSEWTAVTSTGSVKPADALNTEMLAELAHASAIVCDPANYPQSKTACIVSCFASEFQRDFTSMQNSMTRAGFTPQILQLQTLQDILTLRQKLPTCGILYLASHGVVGKDLEDEYGNQMVTEITAATGNPADMQNFANNMVDAFSTLGGDMASWISVTAHKGKAYWTLTPKFFDGITYPNTLVYADMCSSDAALPGNGEQLKDVFEANGAGAFLGWQSPINAFIADNAADDIFNALAPSTPVNIAGITITAPANVAAGESYTVSAGILPAMQNIVLSMGVQGTDGYTQDDTETTDASGKVTFAPVPAGAAGVSDTVTVSAGSAGDFSSVSDAIAKDPLLQNQFLIQALFGSQGVKCSISNLTYDASSDFNLACNNTKLTSTQTVVKFSAAGSSRMPRPDPLSEGDPCLLKTPVLPRNAIPR